MYWLAERFVRVVHWLLRKRPYELSEHDRKWLEEFRRRHGKRE